MSNILSLMPLLLSWSFIAIYYPISRFLLPLIIYATSPYETITSIRWSLHLIFFFKFVVAVVLNPFLRLTGDLLINPGSAPAGMNEWEIIPIIIYFWFMFSTLLEYIPSWVEVFNEASQKLAEIELLLTEQHCQDLWKWILGGFHKNLTWTLIFVPLFRFILIHLVTIIGISVFSALVQLKFLALFFYLLALPFLIILKSYFSAFPFPVMVYLNKCHAVRHDLLRLADKLNNEKELSAYLRNPYQYRIEE